MRMFVATWALMACHVAAADELCGLPDQARVVATIRFVSLSELHEKQWAERGLGRWKALTADFFEDYLDHTERATWDKAFGGQVPLPESPYCRYPNTRATNADVELRVYRLEGNGLPTFRADDLYRLHGVYLTSGGSPSKYELLGEVTFVDLAGASLCGIPDDAQVVATIRAIAVPEYLEEVTAQEGRWGLLSAKRNDTSAHTENARWDHTFGGLGSLPDSPYCRYPRIERGFGNVHELRVYRLEGDDLPTVSASDLFDFYFFNADLRELGSNYELLGDPSDWIEESPVASPAEIGDRDHFLAVATSPDAGTRIAPGESGYYGIGWHTESQHDAGLIATAECRKQGGGSACFSNASGKSLRGGCVGLAMAKWRDRDEDAERAYVVTSSSFRDLIARDLRSGCESTAFSGKHENTVLEHSCEIVQIMCAGRAVPADGFSDPG